MTSDTFLPRIGGAEIHVQNIIANLEREGHRVRLLTTEVGASPFDAAYQVERVQWSKWRIPALLERLWELSNGADIIHSHYCHKLALLAGIVARLRGIPIVITLHGMGILDHPGTPFIYRQAHSFYRYWSLQLASEVISTSQDLADLAYKYIPKAKVRVIPNGYDERLFNERVVVPPELAQRYASDIIILSARRLVPKNGIQYLIEAMPYICDAIPSVRYLAIGDGRMRGHIEERVRALRLDSHVELLGEVPNRKLPEFYKLARVVVFPSTAESSSLACAEALAIGSSVVASRVGGLVELIGASGERGRLVKIVDWESSNYDAPPDLPSERYRALADTVIEAIRDPDRSREERAQLYAKENLSWPSITRQTIETYQQLIHRL